MLSPWSASHPVHLQSLTPNPGVFCFHWLCFSRKLTKAQLGNSRPCVFRVLGVAHTNYLEKESITIVWEFSGPLTSTVSLDAAASDYKGTQHKRLTFVRKIPSFFSRRDEKTRERKVTGSGGHSGSPGSHLRGSVSLWVPHIHPLGSRQLLYLGGLSPHWSCLRTRKSGPHGLSLTSLCFLFLLGFLTLFSSFFLTASHLLLEETALEDLGPAVIANIPPIKQHQAVAET